MEKQNVTLSLPKSLLKKAKTLAEIKDKSLSELLRETLEGIVKEETGYKKAKERQIALMKKGFNLGTKGHIMISREELHKRKDLRELKGKVKFIEDYDYKQHRFGK